MKILSLNFGLHLWSAALLLLCWSLALVCGAATFEMLGSNILPGFITSDLRTENGLPSERIKDVRQTRDGYLWVATFNGLARFDGVHFKVFNEVNTPGLPNHVISCLFEDRAGRLWIGTETGEVAWCDQDGFHTLKLPGGWQSNWVCRITQATDGTVWVLSRQSGLLPVRNLEAGAVIAARNGPRLFHDVVADTEGTVWLLNAGGALERLEGDRRIVSGDGPPVERSWQRHVASARQGGLWVRDGERLRRWHNGQWAEDRGSHLWMNFKDQRLQLCETSSGEVLVATSDRGTCLIGADGREIWLTRNPVGCCWEDREGNLWLGTLESGLNCLRPRAITMIDFPGPRQNSELFAVIPSSGGGLWIGSRIAGVWRVQEEERRFDCWADTNQPATKLIRSLLEDRDGTLWAGSGAGGLFHLENGRFAPLPAPFEVSGPVFALFQARDGAIWAGTQNGVLRREGTNWSWMGRELFNPNVRCFTEAPDGSIWLGMRGGGLARWKEGQFKQYSIHDGLPSENVWVLHADAEGAVWIGTPGGGLVRWRDDKFYAFTRRQGLPSEFICQIADDGNGNLWLGSHAGLIRVAKAGLERCARGEARTVNCLLLDDTDGLSCFELAAGNQSTACETPDGRLWFATAGHGLAMIAPDKMRLNRQAPPVRVEEVLVDGQPCSWKAAGTEANPPTQDPPLLRVAPGSRQIEFRYTALSLSAPKRVCFKYLLAGLDKDWIDAGTQREAHYSRLPPGNYTFQVIACNNHGVWNEQGAAVRLTVLPQFWQTWWFAAGCWAAGLSGVGAAFIFMRRWQSVRVARLERTRIAQDLHDTLGSGLTEISSTSALVNYTAMPPQEAREYFREINQRAHELVVALDEIVWTVNPKNDTVASLAHYFGQVTHHFLKSTPIRPRFELAEGLPARPLNSEQRHHLFLAFKEALSNAVQHSGATELLLAIGMEHNVLAITVQDNGRGLGEGPLAAGADGLANMRSRLKQLGGRCEITKAEGGGTRVRFLLSLPAWHR